MQEILCFEQVENGRRKTLRQLGRLILCCAVSN